MARILIVDDDAALLRLLGLRLRGEGHEVVSAESGEAALARVAQGLPDLVITDMRMGGMDGLQLFESLHRRHPLLPVIMLTAHGTIPDAVKALQRGVFGYIPKPFEARELMAEVDRALDASRALGANVPVDGGDGDDGEGDPRHGWREAILTRSPRMEQVLAEARMVAATDASVLVHGPSGSGKELLARAIHAASPRAEKPFVAINCGAIPENLVESELFGHAKGAFTGAVKDRAGLLAQAQRGTVFLDEIGDLPLAAQVKLLRVLQEREVRPVGSERVVPLDVRVICASHKRLEDEVAAGRFREDLFYRLHVVNLELPALADRREDIPLLAQHFLVTCAQRYARPVNAFAPGILELFSKAPWPGNVRQLQNTVEKCVVLSAGPLVDLSLAHRALADAAQPLQPLDEARREFERDYLTQLLKLTGGNAAEAARLAHRNRTDFYALLARHELQPAAFKPGA